MSDIYYSSLCSVKEHLMSTYFGAELGELLTGNKSPVKTGIEREKAAARALFIGTRNNWFKYCTQEIIHLSGVEELNFLTGANFTHKHQDITMHKGERVWQETTAFTILNTKEIEAIAAIERVVQWCLNNAELAAPILEGKASEMRNSYELSFFTLNPNDEGLGDGENPEFFFSTLKSMAEILKFSRHNRCYTVYSTTLSCGP